MAESDDQPPTQKDSEQTGNFQNVNKIESEEFNENEKLLKAIRDHFKQKIGGVTNLEDDDSESEIKNVIEGAANEIGGKIEQDFVST